MTSSSSFSSFFKIIFELSLWQRFTRCDDVDDDKKGRKKIKLFIMRLNYHGCEGNFVTAFLLSFWAIINSIEKQLKISHFWHRLSCKKKLTRWKMWKMMLENVRFRVDGKKISKISILCSFDSYLSLFFHVVVNNKA